MLSSHHPCIITHVGEIKEKDSFKKCIVRVRTKELADEFGTVVRQSGEFDAEVAIGTGVNYEELKKLVSTMAAPNFLPCTFILRSFFYTEKNQQKLGKQLQLKRWWR